MDTVGRRKQLNCNVCTRENKEREAKHYCHDCGEYLCVQCKTQHGKFKTTLSHKVDEIEDDGTILPSDDYIEELGKEHTEKGWNGIAQKIKVHLTAWKNSPLNVAVIGQSGAGKSSFINALRNLNPEDAGAAAVGVTETTNRILSYPHPNNAKLLLWDLPGVGTPLFPQETYLKDIEFERYDFYIIISANRFTELDAWLAQLIEYHGKKYFFVRTQIDISLMDESDSEDEMLLKIRKDCKANLKTNMESVPLFLLSSRKRDKWDFPKAMEQLAADFPALKRDAIILSLSVKSKAFIREKKKVLAKRIPEIATLAIGPERECKLKVDVKCIFRECSLYAEQFSLDQKSIDELVQATESPRKSATKISESLRDIIQKFVFSTEEDLRKWITDNATEASPPMGARMLRFYKFLGKIGIKSEDASYSRGSKILRTILNDYEGCAYKVLEKVGTSIQK